MVRFSIHKNETVLVWPLYINAHSEHPSKVHVHWEIRTWIWNYLAAIWNKAHNALLSKAQPYVTHTHTPSVLAWPACSSRSATNVTRTCARRTRTA